MNDPSRKEIFVNKQLWIFTVRYAYPNRVAVVGSASMATVEAALHLAAVPEAVRAEIRGCDLVRRFVEGAIDLVDGGYTDGDGYVRNVDSTSDASDETSGFWTVCIGSVQTILP